MTFFFKKLKIFGLRAKTCFLAFLEKRHAHRGSKKEYNDQFVLFSVSLYLKELENTEFLLLFSQQPLWDTPEVALGPQSSPPGYTF